MRRREFLAGIVSTAAWPLLVRAETAGAPRRIGVLMGYANDPIAQERLALFRRALEATGWIDGKTARIRSQSKARIRKCDDPSGFS